MGCENSSVWLHLLLKAIRSGPVGILGASVLVYGGEPMISGDAADPGHWRAG
jgi:hypothetical protein